MEFKDGVDSESIYNSMMVSLHKAGMDDEFLKMHLISIATDGSAVLTGKASGLIAKLKKRLSKRAVCTLSGTQIRTRGQKCSLRSS